MGGLQMSTHLTILLWLGIIFVVAASIILGLLLKSKKEERKESYLGFTVIFYIFGFALLIYILLFGIL
ncbi:conserved domain protein [Staphylococcus hominis subsp. hominis C80]|nr:conserved domain protein [Staphylococcus hominis subsp. hominis C80]